MSSIFTRKKKFISFFLIFFIPFYSFNQNLSGVWTGKLYNDTTHQFIPFELIIHDSGGKITGFSQTTFEDGNEKSIGVKSQKIRWQNGELKIEDESFIYNNYPGGPPKGVKMSSELRLKENNDSATLTGKWKTNPTKLYRPLSGTIYLQRKNDKPQETSLVKKLIELGMAKQVAFLTSGSDENNTTVSSADIANTRKLKEDSLRKVQQEEQIAKAQKAKEDSLRQLKEQEEIAKVQKAKEDSLTHQKELEEIAKVEKAKEDSLRQLKEQEEIAKAQKAKEDSLTHQKELEEIAKVEKAKEDSLKKIKEQEEIAKAKKAKEDLQKQQQEKLLYAQQAKEELARERKAEEERVKAQKEKDEIAKQQLAENEAAKVQKAKEELARKQKAQEELVKIQKANPTAGAEISKRKIETIRTVEISQDSVVFSLYDNGAVDGDTVTVLINGKVVMPRVGLLATAINKTIYITPDMGDSISVVMYAENLGSIPPNTGLLVIREAKRIYEIRFSGDLSKNSAIILVRKKKE